MAGMRAKLGLRTEMGADRVLVPALLAAMQQSGADFTDTFRQLAVVPMPLSGARDDAGDI